MILWTGATLYAVFGGADFGAGFWDLIAGDAEKGERPRAQIQRSLTPVWEANHVWLIFILVVLWTAFPDGLRGDHVDPLRADRPGRGRDRPARRRLRLPQVDRVAAGAAGAGRRLRALLGPDARSSWAPWSARSPPATFPPTATATPSRAGSRRCRCSSARCSSPPAPTSPRSSSVGDARRAGEEELEELLRPPRPRRRRWSPGRSPSPGSSPSTPKRATSSTASSATGLPLVIVSALCGLGVLVAPPARRQPRALRPLAVGAVVAVIWGWGVAQFPYLLPTSLTISQTRRARLDPRRRLHRLRRRRRRRPALARPPLLAQPEGAARVSEARTERTRSSTARSSSTSTGRCWSPAAPGRSPGSAPSRSCTGSKPTSRSTPTPG